MTHEEILDGCLREVESEAGYSAARYAVHSGTCTACARPGIFAALMKNGVVTGIVECGCGRTRYTRPAGQWRRDAANRRARNGAAA